MPYLAATIMEVQRIGNIVSAFPQYTTEEVEINGYNIRAGITVLANIWSVHYDPNHWERPFEFEPGRFLENDLKTLKKQETFIPFGAGRRMCIELLARMNLFSFHC
ncbi:cytochrome P450 2U1-like isoform X2 [Anneissia japonica]|uniref:cytochrome P450 2U1-like isoform X2 n=1 Tax=Anneissia japonica TaxID=1529436 RepID=UPI0014254C10|nr:cytochrome P450 2U1-like isoform X2 [Anneissia japonica]